MSEPLKNQGESIDEPYDSPLRWLVGSRSDHEASYMVDLGSNGLMGECQCKAFLYKTKLPDKVYQCQHIRIARERFARWAIRKFKEVEIKGNQ